MLAEHFRLMAGYNAWANGQVYDAASGLPESEYRLARPAAYFGSIHATLNHLLLVDRLWFGRLDGVALEGITGLDQILCEDLATLRRAREAEDDRIITLIDGLSEAALDSEARELTDSKVSRNDLAELLTGLAAQLKKGSKTRKG